MRIGIITFHWAVNYGAILQTYALQTYLEKKGHEVWIINYKPKKFDLTFQNLLFNPIAILRINSFFKQRKKDKILQKFRNEKLNLTKRFYSTKELQINPPSFDVYITGSDQIFNPSFTLYGENKPTSAYFLDFGSDNIKRIGYAVSFGCVQYPTNAAKIAEPLLKRFDVITVRENTGVDILKSMSYKDSYIVHDPTLLLESSYYDGLIEEKKRIEDYVFVYILRETKYNNQIKNVLSKVKFSDDNEFSISQWLSNIKYSKAMITNSYHGVIFCIKFHIPFVVLLETKENIGMNDRFYTLLGRLNLLDRIFAYSEIDCIKSIFDKKIDWNMIDVIIKKDIAIDNKIVI